ncbi:MAG: putative parvulin-type peptidyl-prolyl cis-trans isomerase precursor [Tenericutes bacterium ADurb.BinA155]|nr:MAG: putative parvulin-type peptidyl-prolyl cis-trans isomerase precursor [Tenericutes bacterium ADurb.BinA155]
MRLTQSKDSLNTPSKLAIALLAGALLSLPVVAQEKAASKGGSVATVNGTAIPQSTFDAFYNEQKGQGAPDSPELRNAVREELIRRELLLQEAKKSGLDKSAAVASQMEMARQAVLVRAFIQDYVKKHPISDAQLKAEYEALKTKLGGTEYKSRHILVETEDQAKAIIDNLKKGAKFEELAKQYFFLPDDIEMVCDDGRSYLAYSKKKYDVIMLDAYSGISVPFQMASKEFFTSVSDHLNDGGVVVSNINMVDNHPGSIDQALAETMKNVFPSVYSYTLGGGSSNRELFASNSSKMINNLSGRISTLSRKELQDPFTKVQNGSEEITTSSICLTDDNADVELRSMSAIDGIIQDSVAQYRAIFKERGLWGLIQYLLS